MAKSRQEGCAERASGPVKPDQSVRAQRLQQERPDFVSLLQPARSALLADPHQSHTPHQAPDSLPAYNMAFVLQMPRHLPDVEARRLRERLVDPASQVKVNLALAFWRLAK